MHDQSANASVCEPHLLAAGKLTLVVDLGSILLESDKDLIAKLPQEEAALYECRRLSSRDISAYVVDGEFSFHSLEAAGASSLAAVIFLVSSF